jgi:putative polyhydroxyalkanoate system protein
VLSTSAANRIRIGVSPAIGYGGVFIKKEVDLMADIVVKQSHQLSLEEVRDKISSFEDMMGKYGVKANWKGNRAKLKGTGVSGSIDVSDSDVTVTIKLGIMAKAVGVDPVRLKGSIEKRLGPALSGSE